MRPGLGRFPVNLGQTVRQRAARHLVFARGFVRRFRDPLTAPFLVDFRFGSGNPQVQRPDAFKWCCGWPLGPSLFRPEPVPKPAPRTETTPDHRTDAALCDICPAGL